MPVMNAWTVLGVITLDIIIIISWSLHGCYRIWPLEKDFFMVSLFFLNCWDKDTHRANCIYQESSSIHPKA